MLNVESKETCHTGCSPAPWQVVQAAEDGKVKIKWGFDSSEAEVIGEELRAKAG